MKAPTPADQNGSVLKATDVIIAYLVSILYDMILFLWCCHGLFKIHYYFDQHLTNFVFILDLNDSISDDKAAISLMIESDCFTDSICLISSVHLSYFYFIRNPIAIDYHSEIVGSCLDAALSPTHGDLVEIFAESLHLG